MAQGKLTVVFTGTDEADMCEAMGVGKSATSDQRNDAARRFIIAAVEEKMLWWRSKQRKTDRDIVREATDFDESDLRG